MRPVLLLMYHQIVPEGAPPGWVPAPLADPRYGVGERDFLCQMAHLREEGYPLLSLDSLRDPETVEEKGEPGRPAIVVTFDDGYESDFKLASPVLSKFRIPATFFVSTGHIGAPGMMTESMVAELSARPVFRIGAHGESHRFLPELSGEECKRELLRSFSRIRELTGQERVAMSAPGGRTDSRVAALAKGAGFWALATSRPGLHEDSGDLFSLPRLPILARHSLESFDALLDPASAMHRADRWVRMGKQGLRALLSGATPKNGG